MWISNIRNVQNGGYREKYVDKSLLIKYSAKWLLTNDITERDYVQNAKNNLALQNTDK